ncbi:F-box family protein isoform X2 [Tasmannia lanceolata]|uniref:F-box family protein isoform X2 n=1 Tax=Tasmannia lanceolata TaxID=3420 RepID=UPI0040631BC3
MNQKTWPFSSDTIRFSILPSPKTQTHQKQEPQKRRLNQITPHKPTPPLSTPPLNPNFSSLPFDILSRIAAPFTVPTLLAASAVCRSWREALRPLREAMVLLRWGKRFKHGRGGVRPNLDKALDSFLKGAARGSTASMVDAGLLYWEMGKKEEGISLYRRAALLGDSAGQCNLGISYLQAEPPKLEEAVKCFYQAAIAGHVRAQYNLALCLHQGRGVGCNLLEAEHWMYLHDSYALVRLNGI